MRKVTGGDGVSKDAPGIGIVGGIAKPTAAQSAPSATATALHEQQTPDPQLARKELERANERSGVAADNLRRDFGVQLELRTRELSTALASTAVATPASSAGVINWLNALAGTRSEKVLENVRAAASDPAQLGVLLQLHRELRAIEVLFEQLEARGGRELDLTPLSDIRYEIKRSAVDALRAYGDEKLAAGDLGSARALVRKAFALSESDADRTRLETLAQKQDAQETQDAQHTQGAGQAQGAAQAQGAEQAQGVGRAQQAHQVDARGDDRAALPLHRRYVAAGRKLVDPQVFRDIEAALGGSITGSKDVAIAAAATELRDQLGALRAERREHERSGDATPASLDKLDAKLEMLESRLGRLTSRWKSTAAGRSALAAMETLRKSLLERTELRSAESFAETLDVSAPARKLRGAGLKDDLVELIRMLGTGVAGAFDQVTAARVRAAWEPDDREVDLGADGGTRGILFHEAGHAFEAANAVLREVSASFVDARASGPSALLSELTGAPYRSDERARPDEFISAYVGREYARGFTEVLSTGLERFASAASMLDLLVKDREHFLLVLGMVTS